MFCTNCGRENPDGNRFCLQCGQPLATTDAAPAPQQPESQTQPGRSSRRLPLLLGGVLLLAVLAVGAYFLLPRLTGGGGGGGAATKRSGNYILLATERRGGSADLSVLKLGDDIDKATVIAENVSASQAYLNLIGAVGYDGGHLFKRTYLTQTGMGLNFGTESHLNGDFLPGTNRLVAFFADSDLLPTMVEYKIGAKKPVTVVSESEDMLLFAFPLSGARDMMIVAGANYNDDSSFCYMAKPGEKATRVTRRSDRCGLSDDGLRILSIRRNIRNEVTITSRDLKGKTEIDLMKNIDTNRYAVSPDASSVAYSDGKAVLLVDAKGDRLFMSDDFFQINVLGFLDNNTVYYMAQYDPDTYELYTSASDKSIIEAPYLQVIRIPDKPMLAILSGDSQSSTTELSIFDLKTGALTEVATGDRLRAKPLGNGTRLLVGEIVNRDTTLTTIDLGKSGFPATTLFDERDYIMVDVYNPPGNKWMFLYLIDEDHLNSLFVAPLDGTTPGFFVAEEWHTLRPLHLSGDKLLLAGQEDARDDEALYIATLGPNGDLIMLDDSADSYDSGVISANGRSAIYTVTDRDKSVVRQVSLNGKDAPTDLYTKAQLVAVQWASIDMFSDINSLLFLRQ